MTLSKSRSRFPGAYPRSIRSAGGARVLDEDALLYVDWNGALGAVSLGWGDAAVDAAVHAQVSRGPLFSLPSVAVEERAARPLADLVLCAEAVRFFKTGSEATEAAVRVARAATGRDVVLSCGYHGWHSMWAAVRPEHPGVPESMTPLIWEFPYNDALTAEMLCDRIVRAYGAGPAAIILEPTNVELPAEGFLEGVRALATEVGAVLIFDEMFTGFRWHRGGYQALCGVTPDLATFGKAMGNGYAVAALVGQRDLMRWSRLASGTFGGDLIGIVAATAVMGRYARDDVPVHMAALGRRLIDDYQAIAADVGENMTWVEGQPPHPVIRWGEVDSPVPGRDVGRHIGIVKEPNRHRASLFFQEVVRRGHLVHPEGINFSAAHTSEDVASLLAACREAAAIVAGAVRKGDVRARIEGDPIDPTPAWRTVT